MALRDRARRALAAALFPDLPPEAAAQAAAGLPGLEEAAARLADLLEALGAPELRTLAGAPRADLAPRRAGPPSAGPV